MVIPRIKKNWYVGPCGDGHVALWYRAQINKNAVRTRCGDGTTCLGNGILFERDWLETTSHVATNS